MVVLDEDLPIYIPLADRPRPPDPELDELRELMEEHDHLMELCSTTVLEPEEVKLLDNLVEFMILKEYERWEGVDPIIVEAIDSHSTEDYPTLRMLLGHDTDKNH